MSDQKKAWLKNLYPSYFTTTMAIGIISIALELQGYLIISEILSILAILSWFGLTILIFITLLAKNQWH